MTEKSAVRRAMEQAAAQKPSQVYSPHPGDVIEVRDVNGDWHPAVAMSEARVDRDNGLRGHYYWSVSVQLPSWDHPINWPVEDVRLIEKAARD